VTESASIQQDEGSAAAVETAPPPMPAARGALPTIVPEMLGSPLFRKRFGLRYAYVAGAMYRGVAGPKLVVRLGKAGLMGFFGAGGLSFAEVEQGIQHIQRELRNGEPYGINLLANYSYPELERRMVDLYLRYNVRVIEAAAFMQMSSAIVLFRLKGLKRAPGGGVETSHRILAKVSRPEVAEAFMSPAPEYVVEQLLKEGLVTAEQAQLAKQVPVSEDICVEADSGGHTDGANPTVLFPAMVLLKKRLEQKYGYVEPICMGYAGGVGAPEAAASAFLLGADFILTGSINQCTVEADMSDDVKTLLQDINVQDTEYAPAGDMFETGAKIQVLKKGVFFPTRANKLFSLYSHYNRLEEIPEKTQKQLQSSYFKKTFAEIWQETRDYFEAHDQRHEIVKAEANPKHKMALTFRWYFGYTSRLAQAGKQEERINYQVHTGPALGAFNQWVKGTELEPWSNRHADDIGKKLLAEAAAYLNHSLERLFSGGADVRLGDQ
jgi:trans-AT polyketide synthase/acyltransferase/oxidoreductase domain-containing protein